MLKAKKHRKKNIFKNTAGCRSHWPYLSVCRCKVTLVKESCQRNLSHSLVALTNVLLPRLTEGHNEQLIHIQNVFPCCFFRWCCWLAARVTAATRPAQTPSSPSALCLNNPLKAPALAAVRTHPSWRRLDCAAVVGHVLRPHTDTSWPATVRNAAEQGAASSKAF